MGTIITLLNEKGGVGKSTLCFNIGWLLSEQRNKVLFIDLDGQRANLTYFCGAHKDEELLSFYDIMVSGADTSQVIKPIKKNLWLLPATDEVVGLNKDNAPIKKMINCVSNMKDDYDYIFIDVNPTPGRSHALALSVSDYIIIPMLADVTSLMANMGIFESVNIIKESINPNLKMLGFAFNRFNKRTNLTQRTLETAKQMADKMNCIIFKSKIRNNIALSENVSEHIGVTSYAPRSKGAEDIISLTKEIKKEISKNG